ncbi:MAG: zinc dependent phospholipase C family protein [Peptostreptococcaceae bacterium]
MPDIITHYLFGLDTTNNIKSSPLYKIIKEQRSLFFVGLQGPDPMYYHAPYKKNNFTEVAKLMHTENTRDFLAACLSYSKNLIDTPEFEPCMSYISGLLCHYVLDSMCHPYIFYIGGRYIKGDDTTRKYLGLHKKIELAIDALLLEEKFNLKADVFKINKHILKQSTIPPIILDMYEEVLFNIYAIPDGANIFKQSYSDFRNYFKITFDRIGAKKIFAQSLSPMLSREVSSLVNTFSYHNCVDEFSNYLNTSKEVWLHPVTGNVYTFSFKDLIHNALKRSSFLLLQSYAFTQSEISSDELLGCIPNVSYLTGLSLEDTRPMTYFSDKFLYL